MTAGRALAAAAAANAPPSALQLALQRSRTASDALIADMKSTFKSRVDKSDVLLQLSTRYLLVGRCDSRFSGTAKFTPSKVIYAFEHPTHRQGEMHMAYCDMIGVRTQPSTAPPMGRGCSRTAASSAGGAGGATSEQRPQTAKSTELRFRIGAPLSYFTREYDPNDPAHDLRIGFLTEADAHAFRQNVLPEVLRQSS